MTQINCHCGKRITVEVPSKVKCQCGAKYETRHHTPDGTKPIREGLGDWTERHLQSIGVTKERYKAAKELFGLAPTCGCDARKQWLNSVSDWWRGG